MDKIVVQDNENGLIISEEVIATIAATAALDVPGVSGMAAKPADISGLLKKDVSGKSVKVGQSSNELLIDVYIVVEENAKIQTVALLVQQCVKDAVQNMTGTSVAKVNVHVADVQFEAKG